MRIASSMNNSEMEGTKNQAIVNVSYIGYNLKAKRTIK